MAGFKFICRTCEKEFLSHTSARGKYCTRTCSHEARRLHIPKAELVERKRLYDIQYRSKNRERLKAKKSEYFKRVYSANPDKFRYDGSFVDIGRIDA